jgi:hypothetical protein
MKGLIMLHHDFSLAPRATTSERDGGTDQETPSPRHGRTSRELHSWEVELACARALLDELETVLEREHQEQARSDVMVQVAEQLERTAATMKQWVRDRARNHRWERRRD